MDIVDSNMFFRRAVCRRVAGAQGAMAVSAKAMMSMAWPWRRVAGWFGPNRPWSVRRRFRAYGLEYTSHCGGASGIARPIADLPDPGLRLPGEKRAIKARITLKTGDPPGAVEGAYVQMRARLVPPAPPRLPGGYDFARAAWFSGLAATGSALGPVTVESARARRAVADASCAGRTYPRRFTRIGGGMASLCQW
jgi:hypothetical protein